MVNQKGTGRRVMNLRLAVVAGLALGLAGCTNQIAKDGEADAFISIVDINGGSPLKSDVVTKGSVFNDLATVTVAARSKNPRFNETQYTRAFRITRYEIRYYRADGRNVEGVDVPYRIAGNLTTAVDIGEQNAEISIEFVRVQAKLEPPLRTLAGGGGAIAISCFAEVTLYATQIASGDVAMATGTLQINFADWADQ